MSIRTFVFAMLWAVVGGIAIGGTGQIGYGLIFVACAMYLLNLVDGYIEAIIETRERRP